MLLVPGSYVLHNVPEVSCVRPHCAVLDVAVALCKVYTNGQSYTLLYALLSSQPYLDVREKGFHHVFVQKAFYTWCVAPRDHILPVNYDSKKGATVPFTLCMG